MTITCPKCHHENPDETLYCGKCATSLPSPEEVKVTETLEAPKEELTTGSVFAGRYQIIEELGKGGMGKVYKAVDKEINAKIALKLIKPEIASDKNTIERFRNELKIARDISHKNVCRMYDLNKEEGSYYITMEYVSGEDLKSFIRRSKQLAIGTAVSIAEQISEGLFEAHRLGAVHRDLKPSNIMIDRDGNVRIMDFGIARLLTDKGITDKGVMIGTPDYMSPEQVEGRNIDHRTDIYSLGVILYEMVTGKLPFEGETALSIAHKHKYEKPQPPKTVNPQIPDELDSVILKCLEKEKEKRYSSAEQMRADLTNIEERIPTTQRIVHEKRPLTSREITVQFNLKKLAVPAAIFLGIVIIGLALWRVLLMRRSAPVLTGKPSLAIMYFKNNTGDASLDHWRTMLTDLLIKDLAQSRYIRVLSEDKLIGILEKQNQLEAKGYSTDVLREVAAEGRVNHILQGNYAKAGAAYRVNVTLQDAATMEIIASDGVEGTGEDSIFSMVDELTRKIKGRFKLSAEEMSTDIDRDVAKITTSSPEAYKFYSQGLKVGERGDIRKSLQFYEKAVSIDPEFASAYIQMAIAYYNLRLRNEEKKYLEKAFALRDRISEREQYLSEAELYSTSERTYNQAIDAFKKLLDLYPDDIDGNAELGWVYMTLEKYDEAIKQYEIVIQNKTEDITCYSNLARCYQAKGMYERARQLLESYFNDYPDNARIHHRLAILFIQQGELDLALAEVDKAYLLDPAHYMNFSTKGDIYLYKGDFVKSEGEYQNLSEAREPASRSLSFWNLSSLCTLQGKFADAMALAKEGVESSEQSGQHIWRTLSHTGLSYLLTKSGNPEAGLRECEMAWKSAIEADYIAGQKDVLLVKGLAYLQMGSISKSLEAAEELKSLIEKGMNESRMRMYYRLMARIELQRKNFVKAREYSEKALSLTFYGPLTKDAEYINTLAAAYYESGDLVNALNQYERITHLTTGRIDYGDIYAKSFYMLGKIYEEQGETAKAIEHYEKFLDLWKIADPGIAEVEDARRRVGGL